MRRTSIRAFSGVGSTKGMGAMEQVGKKGKDPINPSSRGEALTPKVADRSPSRFFEKPNQVDGSYSYEDQGASAAGPFGFGTLRPFKYGTRFSYIPLFGSPFQFSDFMLTKQDEINFLFRVFTHRQTGVKVTLIPIIHVGHPAFFKRVDLLCSQHDSVLMEGRRPELGAEHSSIVPPRKMMGQVRPEGHEDDEGWEPAEDEGFWQPFSWGVIDSPNHTVIHAADKYDYEKLPYWAAVRFSLPIFGNYDRDKHCMNLIPKLSENGYKSFAVPWGAYHMPVMATMLVRNGFIETGGGAINVFKAKDGVVSSSWCKKMHAKKKFNEQLAWYFIMITIVPICFWYDFFQKNWLVSVDYHINVAQLMKDSPRWQEKAEKEDMEMMEQNKKMQSWPEIKKELEEIKRRQREQQHQ